MITVELFLIWETEKAYRFSRGNAQTGLPQFWLPKSQIDCLTILGEQQTGWRFCRVSIPEWLAAEKWLGGRNPFEFVQKTPRFSRFKRK